MPKISHRAASLAESPIRKLAPLAEDAKRRGVRVHHLNIGQPDIETPRELRARLSSIPAIVAYTPSGGTEAALRVLRGAYAKLGFDIAPDEMLITSGASEALQFAFLALLDPGDDILLPEPFYTNYATFAAAAGASVRPLYTAPESGFHLPDDAAILAAIGPRTRAIVLCNPNNPTGTLYTEEELRRVAEICKARDLFLVADEVYRDFAYDGRKAMSALALPGMSERAIVVDSLSKRYGACGLRLGCLITKNHDVYSACMKLAQARLSPPGLAQIAALGIEDLPSDYMARVVAEYEARRDVLFAALRSIDGVTLQEPEGAFYFIAGLPVADGEAFSRFLLTDFSEGGETVMLAPAAGFYATPGLGKREVRIAYVLEKNELARAAVILRAALARYEKR